MASELAESGSKICAEQNSEHQLARLAAQRSLYGSAKLTFAVHAVLSTGAAAALAFAAQKWDWLKPYAAVWGLALTVLDIVWLTPHQKSLRETAATIQEAFDCDVLGLPAHPIKTGKPPDPEIVAERARRYRTKEPSLASLRDWYPVVNCQLPLFLARLGCQRANAWWDAKQRRRYALFLVSIVAALIVGLLLAGIARDQKVADVVVAIVLPLSSGIVLALRQYRENVAVAARLDKLKDHARDLWTRAVKGATADELLVGSRSLQDELFDHRKTNVPVFDWIYWALRAAHEQQMQDGAAELVRELAAARSIAQLPHAPAVPGQIK